MKSAEHKKCAGHIGCARHKTNAVYFENIIMNPRVGRVKQFLTLYIQVGVLSVTLRFQHPASEGTKTAPAGRPASRNGSLSGLPYFMCRSKYRNITHHAG